MATTPSDCQNYPPEGYQSLPFPSLCWPPQNNYCALYTIWDSWRYTLLWTLILYALFHFGAAGIALSMQIGKPRLIWKYLLAVPLVYALVAGAEALFTGSIVGLVYAVSPNIVPTVLGLS
ncbi:hypothetical protein GGS26DRAFT_541552 [Hypomontagnella submonticulosa]|nr:hypothetical protein GGS26DRAFT_541552 [Hypomontagnella submonticulosa]